MTNRPSFGVRATRLKRCGQTVQRSRRACLGIFCSISIVATTSVSAFTAARHQELTFLAAQEFNQCVAPSSVPRLTALQVRYIARANRGIADRNFWRRLSRWDYYDRDQQSGQKLLGFVDTRFHEFFRRSTARLGEQSESRKIYSTLGEIVHYLQEVASPAHVVPIRIVRPLRFRVTDSFDSYPIDKARLIQAPRDRCASVLGLDSSSAMDLNQLLVSTADRTIESVQTSIQGMPATWQAFWKLGDAGSFGDYGVAGNNFGRRTSFRCPLEPDQRCLLLEDDPIYAEYAAGQHMLAIEATMIAIGLLQTGVIETRSQDSLTTIVEKSEHVDEREESPVE